MNIMLDITRKSCFSSIRILGCCIIIVIAGCIRPSEPHAISETASTLSTFNVGYRILDIPYGPAESAASLTVAVWYPTDAPPGDVTYGGPTKGKVARDAVPLERSGGYPILFFSHGYGGGGIGSVFFTEALAARGWIVVAPDHHDNYSAVRIRTGRQKHFNRIRLLKSAKKLAGSTPDDRSKWLYRLDEMAHVLNHILDHSLFSPLIDKKRIAIGGHSLGGFTAAGLCGTIPEYHDSRIKGVLLFSTGAAGYLFTEKELGNIHIPCMMMFGESEMKRGRGTRTISELSTKLFNSISPPKYFLEIKSGNHFSFNNRFANTLASRSLSGDEREFDIIRRYGIAFLEKHVAGKTDQDHLLAEKDPMLTRFIVAL